MTTQKPTALTLSEKKRAAILAAAAAEFQSNGYLATSMDRIASAAGVSKRTVYNHFPSKEDLFRAMAGEVWRQTMEAVELPYDAKVPIDQQLAALGTMKLGLLRRPEYSRQMRAVLAECFRSPERAREVFTCIWSDEDTLARWMKSAMQDGRLRKGDPKVAAEQFWGLVKYPVFLPLTLGLIEDLPDRDIQSIVKSAVAMFLSHHGVLRND